MSRFSNKNKGGISRRRFLQNSAVAGAAISSPLLVSSAGKALAANEKIVFWEYKDPPGSNLFMYYEDAAKQFLSKTGIEVEIQFKSAEGIEQAVASAANARQGFDVLLWWSGPTSRNQASLGNVTALDGLIPTETLSHMPGLESMQYEGKQYGITFDVSPWFLVYNRTTLKKAGVSDDAFPPPDEDPIDWASFLDICGKIKRNTDAAPLAWANKQGYFNEWYLYNFQGQAFDSTAEIIAINIGDESWQHPGVYSALEAYRELYQNGYFVEGGEVVPYEQHIVQLASGQAAMSVYFDVAGATKEMIAVYGQDNVGFTKVPAFRSDKKLHGHVCMEPNTLYVASFSEKQDAAVEWLKFLTTVDQRNALAAATQIMPGDDRWDTSLITNPGISRLFSGANAKNQVYPYDFVTQAQYESLLQNGILHLRGDWSSEELAADFDKVDKEYKEQIKG